MSKFWIVAIAGGSGSGKTTLARKAFEHLGEQACLITQDSYYRDQSARFDRDGGLVNFDHPSSLDFELMAQHLGELKQGKPIDLPHYDFATHTRLESRERIDSKRAILVDGILILNEPKLREIFDFAVFIDVPEKTRFERRLLRDTQERGRSPEGVKDQFRNHVAPMHDQFVQPSRKYADLVIEHGGTPEQGLETLFARLQETNPHLFRK